MKKNVISSIAAIMFIISTATAANAGVCFRWNDNGESSCIENVTQAECEASAQLWDHFLFFPGDNCECEGESGNLPAEYEPDTLDLDGDLDSTETIRWRYVVVINNCRNEEYNCEEHHQLYRCWKDNEHS